MPHNLFAFSSYDFNYPKFFEYLINLEKELKNNHKYNRAAHKVVAGWRGLFQRCCEDDKIIPHPEVSMHPDEVFQYEMTINEQEMLLHFFIPVLRRYANNLQEYEVSVSKFLSGGDITFSETDTWEDPISTVPIYVVPFAVGGYKGLVVDGNHRLTGAVKHKRETIKAICFPPQIVTTALGSLFEVYIYGLVTDINTAIRLPRFSLVKKKEFFLTMCLQN